MSALAQAPALVAVSPTTRAAAVEARGLVRRYRNGRGVGPIDLDVSAGETVALMGRNGCGKTTLLRVLATVSRPQRGQVRWGGKSATAARAQLGLALDGALEDGGLTGRQATHFWCSQWVSDAREVAARTDAVLQQLTLSTAADDRVATYSYGMRRRLALAAALGHQPALALLDEPTAGLDPEGSAQLELLISERAARGYSTVVASNDARFVEAVADRVAFLDDGLLVRCASPSELLADLPRGRVAELVVDGSCDLSALRVLPGVLDVTRDGAVVVARFEGERTIAALVAAADAPGGRLRELRLRRPDLSDRFHDLTGHPLEERS
ncbi:MAG: ABC transporter ATP-binding protein [Candidatus Dormibacteraeota bacterium]|uniref:ABC transporter ATP-binding protein n=1 Tax=Candidatus Aeolococcus gillhamiae TaxID=3127015 RepID=A0A934N016_9BACT|nr:ABC transporter ATP-binding protein [Candidatus Dormibacteraeota bacterium]